MFQTIIRDYQNKHFMKNIFLTEKRAIYGATVENIIRSRKCYLPVSN